MKICLITGATRGLGLNLSQHFKSQGYYVVGVARKENDLTNLCNKKILDDFYVCDLSKPASVDHFIQQVEKKYHKIDLLIHNAAMQSAHDIINNIHYYGLLQTEMMVNFLAPVKITSHLLPILLESQAQIIVISSLLQLGPKKNAPGYSASKAALANWISNLREQLQHTGIRVIEVIPGLIKTTMTNNSQKNGIDPRQLVIDIAQNLNDERIVLKGAKTAWYISQIAPTFVKRKLLHSED